MTTRKVYVVVDRYEGDLIYLFGTKKKAVAWLHKNKGEKWEENFILIVAPVY